MTPHLQRKRQRNPGPDWGYAFLVRADRWLPRPLFRVLLQLGTWVAVAALPVERRHSRDYLRVILGREPHRREIWRHLYAFTEMFMLRLRVAEGEPHRCRALPGAEAFYALMQSGRPALLGTFHFGNSDLLGFLLGEFERHVHMIRLQVDNSPDIGRLEAQFGKWVTFIWVNASENLLFAIKQAVDSGGSIALKCDRPGYSAKLEAFDFLGASRLFPFTLYHLALMFGLPVVLCVSVPGVEGESLVHSSPVFEPDAGAKEDNLARARIHFQNFLAHVESLLREQPYLWFNFTPLNPVAAQAASPDHRARPCALAAMLKRGCDICAYALGWLLFGVGAMLFNLLCVPLLLLPGRRRLGFFVRSLIQRLLAAWLVCMNVIGVARVRWHGFETVPVDQPAIWVANHPGLADVTFLLARLPGAVCVFKPAIRRNPFLAPAAIMAGSVAGDQGPEFFHESMDRLKAGRSLLIFPEGTRTTAGVLLNPLKPGFALIANQASVPVRVVVIQASRDFLPRGRPWWQVPKLPAQVDLRVEFTLESDLKRSARETAALVEKRLVFALSEPAQTAAV